MKKTIQLKHKIEQALFERKSEILLGGEENGVRRLGHPHRQKIVDVALCGEAASFAPPS